MTLRQKLAELLPRSRFARSVSILGGSTAAAQGLTVAASPFLTRLYTPEDFGVLAVFVGLLSVLAVVVGLRYELAIPLPEDDADAARLLMLAVSVTAALSLVTALAVALCGETLAASLSVPSLGPWLWLLPLALFFTGVYQALYYAALRKGEYGAIGLTRFTRALATLCVQFASFKLGGPALVLGQAVGWSAGFVSLGRLLQTKHSKTFRSALGWSGIRAQAARYKSFPLWSSPGALFNAAGSQLPAIAFAALFSPAAAGLYALTHRVLAMPMQLVGDAVADVFFSDGAEAHRRGELGPTVAKIFEKLVWIAAAPSLILVLAAPSLFALLFGEEWRGSGEMARWLAPWLFVAFLASPLSRVFMITERLAELTLLQVLIGFARVLPILAGYYLFEGDLTATFKLFAAASFAVYVVALFSSLIMAQVPLRHVFVTTVKSLLVGTVVSSPVIAALAVGDRWWLFVAVVTAVVFYGISGVVSAPAGWGSRG